MNLSTTLHEAGLVPRKLSAARTRFDPVYSAIHELIMRHGGEASGLTAFEYRVFSQNGEDGVIAEIFRRIGTTNRFFVEFGIGDGWQGNSVFLGDVLDWTGLFAEPDTKSYERIRAKYQHSPRVRVAPDALTSTNVNAKFTEWQVPDAPDLVSIDIDGNDYYVWSALKWHPRVVIIEYNGYLSADVTLVQPESDRGWDGSQFFGASPAALIQLGRDKGYTFVHADLTGTNLFFVRDDLAASFGPGLVRQKNQALLGIAHRSTTHFSEYELKSPRS